MDSETKKIQDEIIKVFKIFKKICDDHELTYFAIGGTAIGAARHSGFIPWDDDLDVGMPYDDYNKFIEIFNKSKIKGFSLMTPFNTKHYSSLFLKIQNDNTTFIEKVAANYPDRWGGVYVDVFPLFGFTGNEKSMNKLRRKANLLRHLNTCLRYPFSEFKSKKFSYKLFWLICSPLKLFLKFDYFTKKQFKFFSKYNFYNSEYVYFSWHPIPKKNTEYYDFFPHKMFEFTKNAKFEDINIKVCNDLNGYLTIDYGDYMKLPPVEKQIGTHEKAFVDLNKPFKDYNYER